MIVNFTTAVLFVLFVFCALRADYHLAKATVTGKPTHTRKARRWLAVALFFFGFYAGLWFYYV